MSMDAANPLSGRNSPVLAGSQETYLSKGVLAQLALSNEKQILDKRRTSAEKLLKYQLSMDAAKKLGIEIKEPIMLVCGVRPVSDIVRNGAIVEQIRHFNVTNSNKDQIIEILKCADNVKKHFDLYFDLDRQCCSFEKDLNEENKEYLKLKFDTRIAFQKIWKLNQEYQNLQTTLGIRNYNCFYALTAPADQ